MKLRLTYPDLGRDSADLYGKVVGEEELGGTRLTRIRLTAIDPDDERMLGSLLAAAGRPVHEPSV